MPRQSPSGARRTRRRDAPRTLIASVRILKCQPRVARLGGRRFHEPGAVAGLLRVNDVGDDVVDLVGVTKRIPADDRAQLAREQLDAVGFAELVGEDLALRGEAQRALGDDLPALCAPGVARLRAFDMSNRRALCGLLALSCRRLCTGAPNESRCYSPHSF